MVTTIIQLVLVTVSLIMTAQAGHTIYLMLYTWNKSSSFDEAQAPTMLTAPALSFTVLIPARHEEAVIATTLKGVMASNYPKELLELLLICEASDTGTITEAMGAKLALEKQGITGARVITFADGPINKPHGLNVGLAEAKNDVVVVFDAEDEIHPDLLRMVNTVMVSENVRVLQSGVQVMNHASTWYSAHHVLEYFFWFKSRLHVHAKNGMTPLGGNTVFFQTQLLRSIGGWDENNLTEDADIGIRLSAMGERVRVVYDDKYVTKEEAAPDLSGFVKQRTRWNQGFLQTLRKGTWRQVPDLRNRLQAVYILSYPFLQTLQVIYTPISLAMIFLVKLPMIVTLILLLPGYMLIGNCLLSLVGLILFTRSHKLSLQLRTLVLLPLTYFPFLWVLGYSACRALVREMRGQTNWEKTVHLGAHRVAMVDSLVLIGGDTGAVAMSGIKGIS